VICGRVLNLKSILVHMKGKCMIILDIFKMQRITNAQYTIPSYVKISPECKDLLSCIFVANPAKVRKKVICYFILLNLQIKNYV
jgi:hypothetical protein